MLLWHHMWSHSAKSTPLDLWIRDTCMRMQCFAISFKYDDVIILQFDWMLLVEEWSKFLDLAMHQTIFACIHWERD